MLSLHSGISNKNDYEIGIVNKNFIVYIHNVAKDMNKIKGAIDILDHLHGKLKVITGDTYSMTSEELKRISEAYHNFLREKKNILLSIKEFSQKMIKNIEDLQLPCLEKMLSSRFGYITSGKFICEKCNFIGKNPLALSVHKRTCDKTNLSAPENNSVSPMNILLQTPPTQPVVQIPVQPQQLIQPKVTKILTKNVIQVKPENK